MCEIFVFLTSIAPFCFGLAFVCLEDLFGFHSNILDHLKHFLLSVNF